MNKNKMSGKYYNYQWTITPCEDGSFDWKIVRHKDHKTQAGNVASYEDAIMAAFGAVRRDPDPA